MPPRSFCSFYFLLARLLAILVLGLLGARAMAQVDPPSRVARLNNADGPVAFSTAGDEEWTDAVLNRPLTRGDRLWTDRGSRADVQAGSATVRMNGQTLLEVIELNDRSATVRMNGQTFLEVTELNNRSARLSATQGSVHARVRDLPEGDTFEIDTPNLVFRATYPGEYRIDVDASNGTTRVTVHSGMGAVFGEGGSAMMLGGGQQITFRARTLSQVTAQESPPQDAFDRWAMERDRHEDQSISARYLPREAVGYQQLDAHGQWGQDATHGIVWYPYVKAADWAPYRQGHWEWIAPWGWTWIDDAPWGFAPFHYGRWALIGSRWAWVPGHIGTHPVYAPALVAFVGGGSSKFVWSIASSSGRPGVAWFPLAPGEPWQPGYAASPLYISNVNRNMPPQAVTSYAHQHSQQALTAISADDFHRGRPVRTGWLRATAMALMQAQVVPPPPMPEHSSTVAHQQGTVQRVTPLAANIRVVNNLAQVQTSKAAEFTRQEHVAHQQEEETQKQARQTQQLQIATERQAATQQQTAHQQAEIRRPREITEQAHGQHEQMQPGAQAKRAQQQKLADQSRTAKTQPESQAKREQLAKRVEQAKQEQRAKLEQQAKLEQRAGLERQARLERQAKAKQQAERAAQASREQQMKREYLTKRADQARREEQARRAEQARREALASREEMQRREVHLQQAERARRAAELDAQALREQRARRDEQTQREAQERAAQERQAQREASQRQQQALTEQLRRDQQAWEQQQQRERVRHRPDLRVDRRTGSPSGRSGDPVLSQAG